MDCERWKKTLIEIEYREQLSGCIECNCWWGGKSALIVGLSVKDIQALREGRQKHYLQRLQ